MRKRPSTQSPKGKSKADALLAINSFAIDLMQIPNKTDLFWHVAQNVVGRLGFVDCIIYQADEDQTRLKQVAALGEKNPIDRDIANSMEIQFGQGITGTVALSRQTITVNDLLLDPRYFPDFEPARSEICVPLIYDDFVAGVIDCEHPEPGAFGAEHLEILETIAAMTSAKLQLLFEADLSEQRFNDLQKSHTNLQAETANRRQLESRLYEAQKMEAIGKLTGGVAHDFNNLLAIILGNLELCRDVDENPETQEFIDAAIEATHRGANLTKNMLSFAGRARLEPTTLNLNQIVQNTKDWAERVLPATIDIETNLSERLWDIHADQGSTENALLNLIVNARDAMHDGGKLSIKTANVQLDDEDLEVRDEDLLPGRYVTLSLSDTGKGIPQTDISKIFDPFYTTKLAGEGSGLGLSMILGFMKQSGGTVRVESELNRGTIFKLFFEASENVATSPRTKNQISTQSATIGARILVAEDEVGLMQVLVRVLESSGYTIVQAKSGDEALALFGERGPFDLLLTDIVMPGQTQGPELAEKLRALNPSLPVVFMSGYAKKATRFVDSIRPEDVQLTKPVAKFELIDSIEIALASCGGE